jgi:hypothetical protein
LRRSVAPTAKYTLRAPAPTLSIGPLLSRSWLARELPAHQIYFDFQPRCPSKSHPVTALLPDRPSLDFYEEHFVAPLLLSQPALKQLASLYAENPEKRGEAYELAMKVRKTLSDDPELIQTLAELSYQRKEFAYAVKLLRQSSEKKLLDAKSLYYLGMSHLRANEKQQSREALQEAVAAGLPDPLASEASALVELKKQ